MDYYDIKELLEELIKKFIIKDEASEYQALGLELSKDLNLYLTEEISSKIDNLISNNKVFLKNKKYNVNYQKNILVHNNNIYILPPLSSILKKLKKTFNQIEIAIILTQHFEESLILFIKDY